jgi:Anti-sigma factor NepR
MKENKALTPGSAETDPSQPSPVDQKANTMDHKNGVRETGEVTPLRTGAGEQRRMRPDMTMHTDIRRRSARGKLSREALLKLGKTLVDYYDDIRKEGVPDRFKDILQKFDERKDKGTS